MQTGLFHPWSGPGCHALRPLGVVEEGEPGLGQEEE